MEPMAKNTEQFVFINVPYNFMFSCKARGARLLLSRFARSLTRSLLMRACSLADCGACAAVRHLRARGRGAGSERVTRDEACYSFANASQARRRLHVTRARSLRCMPVSCLRRNARSLA